MHRGKSTSFAKLSDYNFKHTNKILLDGAFTALRNFGQSAIAKAVRTQLKFLCRSKSVSEAARSLNHAACCDCSKFRSGIAVEHNEG